MSRAGTSPGIVVTALSAKGTEILAFADATSAWQSVAEFAFIPPAHTVTERRRHRRGDGTAGHCRGAGPTIAIERERAARLGNNLLEVPAQGSAAALHKRSQFGRGFQTFFGRHAYPGSTREHI
jgi:hypothetical protein